MNIQVNDSETKNKEIKRELKLCTKHCSVFNNDHHVLIDLEVDKQHYCRNHRLHCHN